MKKKWIRDALLRCIETKLWKVMRLNVFLLFAFAAQVWATSSYSQQTKMSLNMRGARVMDVLNQIEDNSEFFFLFNQKMVDVERKVDISANNRKIDDILGQLFAGTNVNYLVLDRQIVLTTANPESFVFQQQKTVSGKVTGAGGDPMPGVTVLVKGSTKGTTTDANGRFSLANVPADGMLVFSFVGMKSQEVLVGEQTVLNIVMREETIGIEEVVAVGYGTQKKVNLTGAVEFINSDKINWKPVGQTSMVLQGVAPGVTIIQNSGQPGKDGGIIRIRGIGTLGTAGQDPLVLIDGVEGKINNVDPNDIENISVLKDAASAAIYGSRAANGVIIITTKRAEAKKISVTYNGYLGWQEPTNMPKLVSGLDHMLLLNEANTNLGQTPTFQQSYIDAYRQNAPSDLYPDTDWQKLTLTNDGMMQNHSLEVSGGTDFIKIRGSVIHLNQNGVIPNTGYNRSSLRINTDIKASEKLSFKFDLRGIDELQYEPSVSVSDIFFHMTGRIPANQEGVLSDGRYGQGWLGSNPVAAANSSGKANNRMFSTILNLQGEWEPIEGLNINFMYAPEFYFSNLKKFIHTINTYYGNGTLAYVNPNKSSLLQRSIRTKTDNIRTLLTYTKSLKDHDFKIISGFEQNGYFYESHEGQRENFPLENYQLLSLGSEINQQTAGSSYEYALRSFFGRFNYNFKEKYLFETNLRYDGSSRFASGNKYGWFPSFSAGWRISEEKFFRNVDFVGNLKLRASWGELGNQNIGNYPFASSVNLTKGYILNEVAVSGASLVELGNSEIFWETTNIFDVGIDMTFLQKFSATADFYIKNTDDILLKLPIPLTVGLEAPYQNAGKVRNTGWELGITHFNSIRDFKYEVGIVLSDVRNEVIDLKGTGPYISKRTIVMEGEPIDAFYGFETDGLFQTTEEVKAHATQFGGQVAPGDIKYVDQNGDGKITADGDRVILGSSIPRYTYSFDLGASYKGFDLNMFLQGVGKANGYRDENGVWAFYVGSTALVRHLDRWTPDNTDASYPRLTFNYPNNEQMSDYWLLNAAYLRMKNLQIGYNIPNSLLKKTFLDNFYIYFSGQNLFTIDNFLDGFDVEAPIGSSGFYSMVKTYTFGITVKF